MDPKSESETDREKSFREGPPSDVRGKNTPRDSKEKSFGSSSQILSEDLFLALLAKLEDVQNCFSKLEEVVRQICVLVGEWVIALWTKAVANSITDPVDIQKKQAEVDNLQ